MIKLILINNKPDIAQYAVAAGVGRIFVDLERHGKQLRQGHLNTWVSDHQMSDIDLIRNAIDGAELLVRLNPLYENTQSEIDEAIARGADLLMLPMFYHAEQVSKFVDMTRGRAKIIPLVETAAALNDLENIVKIDSLHEIYLGLNDLHLELKMHFIFEPLASGMVDNAAAIIKSAHLPFGFGGIARIGEGLLPAETILAQHVRLGSCSVILSRTFHRMAVNLQALESTMNLSEEIEKIRSTEAYYHTQNSETLLSEWNKLKGIVSAIVDTNTKKKKHETIL